MATSDPPPDALPQPLVAGLAAVFVFLWASGFIAAKYGLPYAEPFTLLTCRFLVGAALFVAVCLAMRVPWPRDLRTTVHLLVAGFGVQTLYIMGVFYGISLGISTGLAALVVGLQPLFTGVLAGRVLGETVTRRNWIGLALGFFGLALVVWDKTASPPEALWGLAALVVGLAGITVGTLWEKRFCGQCDVRTTVALQNTMSCVVALALALSVESMEVVWTGEFVFAVLWSAVALSVFGITIYYWLVRRGAAARITSLIYLSPPTTALMGWAMFGEVLSWMVLAGMAAAMAGVALAVRAR